MIESISGGHLRCKCPEQSRGFRRLQFLPVRARFLRNGAGAWRAPGPGPRQFHQTASQIRSREIDREIGEKSRLLSPGKAGPRKLKAGSR
jgi:hypothetical protein